MRAPAIRIGETELSDSRCAFDAARPLENRSASPKRFTFELRIGRLFAVVTLLGQSFWKL